MTGNYASSNRWLTPALWTLFTATACHAIFVLFAGLNQSTLLGFDFRQTQTALSVYWMVQGSNWFLYETPIFGTPWQLPLEFPLYQWIVALLHLVTGFDLKPLGRFVSFAFFLGTLWPIYVFCKYWNGRIELFLVTGTLFLASPIMLFWGRTFLIETTALFFATLWLAYLMAFLSNRRKLELFICIGAGSIAALVKITTLPAFLLAGALIIANDLWNHESLKSFSDDMSWNNAVPVIHRYYPFIFSALVPLIFYMAWAWLSDSIKSDNPLTQKYMSSEVQSWVYGRWALRLKERLWVDAIFGRAIHHSIGFSFVVALPVAMFLLIKRKAHILWPLTGFLFLFPMLVFANVHAIHSYYQVSNAIFIIATVALILLACLRNWRSEIFFVLFATSIALSLTAFYKVYYPDVMRDVTKSNYYNRGLKVGQFLGENTDENSGIFVIGYNYSSELAFYSKRRAVMAEFRLEFKKFETLLKNPQSYFGDIPIGAFVVCDPRDYGRWRPTYQALIDQFVQDLAVSNQPSSVSDCLIFVNNQN